MFMELQFSAAVFCRVIRNRMRALDLCVDRDVPNPDDYSKMMVLDQVVIGDSTTVQRELAVDYVKVDDMDTPRYTPASTQPVWFFTSKGNLYHDYLPYLQVKQELSVLLVHPHDLDTNGLNPSPARRIQLFPVFNVDVSNPNKTTGGGPITLSYKLAYVDFGSERTNALERQLIEAFIAGIDLPASVVDLGAMTQLLGRPVGAVNCGITCDPAGTRVAIRADFKPFNYDIPAAVDPDFFISGPDDMLMGKDWATLIDANVLLDQAVPSLTKALHSVPKMKVLSEPVGSWDAAAATVRMSANIRLLGACPGLVDDIDFDVEVGLGARFSVEPQGVLRVNHQLSRRFTDHSQTIGCALGLTFLYPITGAMLLGKGTFDVSDYLGGLVLAPWFSFAQLLGVIDQQSVKDDLSNNLGSVCSKISDWEYRCDSAPILEIGFVPRQISRLAMEQARGVPKGLALSGTVTRLQEYILGPINSIDWSTFTWQATGRCNANRDGGGSFRAVNRAVIAVDSYAQPTSLLLQARICAARVLTDPLNVFAVSERTDDRVTVQATVGDDYLAAPYDCVVRLVTNRGVRNINLGQARQMTPKDKSDVAESIRQWERLCRSIALNTLPFDELFRVPREPMPPIDTFGTEQWLLFRTLEITRLQPNSLLSLRDAKTNMAYVNVMSSADGRVSMRTLTELRTPIPRTLLYLDFGSDHRQFSAARVERQQILYAHRADIPVTADSQNLRMTNMPTGARHVVFLTGGEEHRWDISVPELPVQVDQRPVPTATNSEHDEAPTSSAGDDSRDVAVTPNPQPDVEQDNLWEPTASTETSRAVIPPIGLALPLPKLTNTRPVPSCSAFLENVFVEYSSESGALRIYKSIGVGKIERGRIRGGTAPGRSPQQMS